MEITVRVVHELSPALEALVRALLSQGGRHEGAAAAPVGETHETGPAPSAALPPDPARSGSDPAPPVAPAEEVPVEKYRTPERLAILKRDWPAGRPVCEILDEMNALPGRTLPDTWRVAVWANQAKLKRPEGFDKHAGVRRAAAPAVPHECEAPGPAVAAELRETPQLVRARELLGMGLHPNDIKAAVKLSAAEFDAVRREHMGQSA